MMSLKCDRINLIENMTFGEIYSGFRKENCESLRVLKAEGIRLSDSNIYRKSSV